MRVIKKSETHIMSGSKRESYIHENTHDIILNLFHGI